MEILKNINKLILENRQKIINTCILIAAIFGLAEGYKSLKSGHDPLPIVALDQIVDELSIHPQTDHMIPWEH